MVLAVVEFESLTTHDRLESAKLVRQVLQLDSTFGNRGIQAFLDQVVDHLSQHELLIKITVQYDTSALGNLGISYYDFGYFFRVQNHNRYFTNRKI